MKNLDNILNIAPDVKEEKLPSIINVESKTEASDDFTYARDNLYDVINKGQDALEEMLEVAIDRSKDVAILVRKRAI